MNHPTQISTLLAAAQAEAANDTPSVPPNSPPASVRPLRPVIAAMPADQRPVTCCSTCPASLWWLTPQGPTAYCRVAHATSYSPADPVSYLDCDQLHEQLPD